MKKSSEEGFILFTILLMIMLLSLFILTQAQLFFMQYKALNRLQEKTQAFYSLEEAAYQIMHHEKSECIVSEENSAAILKLLQSNYCTFRYKQKLYSYLIENLGNHPCIYALSDNQILSTQHKRINITENKRDRLLQLRIAIETDQLPCHGKVTYVKPGVISWREIDYQHFIME